MASLRTPLKWILIATVIGAVFFFVLAVAVGYKELGQEIIILNDTEQDVWIGECGQFDSIGLNANSQKTVRVQGPCGIVEKRRRGVYLGCLLIPREAYDNRGTVRISQIDRSISGVDCMKLPVGQPMQSR
jgi:hypothetical protein